MKIVINCTDCGHPRIIHGIDTTGLVIGELILETHSCGCATKCETCEDLMILKEEIKKLKQQLAAAHE